MFGGMLTKLGNAQYDLNWWKLKDRRQISLFILGNSNELIHYREQKLLNSLKSASYEKRNLTTIADPFHSTYLTKILPMEKEIKRFGDFQTDTKRKHWFKPNDKTNWITLWLTSESFRFDLKACVSIGFKCTT